MKKTTGIVRNRYPNLTQVKKMLEKKRNRFQFSTSHPDESIFSESTPRESESTLASSLNSSQEQYISNEIYAKAKQKLQQVTDIQKKMTVQTKARLTSFKQRDNERYDESISKLASEATEHLVQAEKYLKQINTIQAANQMQQKFYENMKKSLALEIRQVSRLLRKQEKEYFDTIRTYEKNITNNAIELSAEQKMMMSAEEEMCEETTNDLENKKIDDLVRSINKLSTIYKDLNSLVIEQGSLIDRIDVNIDNTLQHTKQAVVHLEGADEAASSTFADKVIKILVILIIILAVIFGITHAT